MEQLREHWWKLLVGILVVVGLVWWRQSAGDQTPESPDEDVELEERTNRFLEESGFEVPEGATRANLDDVTDGAATGVATRVEEEEQTEFSVIASLPDITTGSYQAWIVHGNDEYVRLGSMNQTKGGYIIERSMSGDFSEAGEVIVSREDGVGDSPSEIVLRGEFREAETSN